MRPNKSANFSQIGVDSAEIIADGEDMTMKTTLQVTTCLNSFGRNFHAGEFTHEGRYFCAAHVPTAYGQQWELEEKTVPLNKNGGWVKVPARFNHNRRKATLEVVW